MNDFAEDGRRATCPCCGVRELKAKLYWVRDRLMCEGCGRDEIKEWNVMAATPPQVTQ